MLILFGNGTPRALARYLIDRHAVTEARARGWEELDNGALLAQAGASLGDGRKTRSRQGAIAKGFWPPPDEPNRPAG
jgi:hypothetical protein